MYVNYYPPNNILLIRDKEPILLLYKLVEKFRIDRTVEKRLFFVNNADSIIFKKTANKLYIITQSCVFKSKF